MTKEISQKGIAILGSTGSIGTQTLEVISENPEHFRVELLTAGSNWKYCWSKPRALNPMRLSFVMSKALMRLAMYFGI